MENAKSLGHNDLVSYMKDNFNKKHVKKLVFEEINYPNKNDLNQDGHWILLLLKSFLKII